MTIRVLVAGMLVLAGAGAVAVQSDAGTIPAPAGITERSGEPTQDLPAQIKARIDAFVQAVSSGDPAQFEKMVQEHYTPEYLAQRTPDERRRFIERVKGDLGTLSIRGMMAREGQPVRVVVRGATGQDGRFDITLEPGPPYRIARAGMIVGPAAAMELDDAGPPPAARSSMKPEELARALDDYLAPRATADTFAGTVLVAKDGKPIYERAFGLADRGRKTAITPATRFNIGSINKMFTRTAIAQLMAQGKLALTDTIGKLLPDYPNAEAKGATVEQLLDHKAGVVDFFGPEFEKTPKTRFRSNADYYAFVAPEPLLFAPGARTQYCNGCYVVLGAIIERVSGMRYEDYVATRIFTPAGMTTAGFFHSDRFPAHVAIGYTRQSQDARGTLRSNEHMHGVAGSAAGGAYATAADLLAFDNALRERRLADAAMTAWILNGSGEAAGPRAGSDLTVAGGAPGCNAFVDSGVAWTIVVAGNLDPPAAIQVGRAIAGALKR